MLWYTDTEIVPFSSSNIKKTRADNILCLSYMYLNNYIYKINHHNYKKKKTRHGKEDGSLTHLCWNELFHHQFHFMISLNENSIETVMGTIRIKKIRAYEHITCLHIQHTMSGYVVGMKAV